MVLFTTSAVDAPAGYAVRCVVCPYRPGLSRRI